MIVGVVVFCSFFLVAVNVSQEKVFLSVVRDLDRVAASPVAVLVLAKVTVN